VRGEVRGGVTALDQTDAGRISYREIDGRLEFFVCLFSSIGVVDGVVWEGVVSSDQRNIGGRINRSLWHVCFQILRGHCVGEWTRVHNNINCSFRKRPIYLCAWINRSLLYVSFRLEVVCSGADTHTNTDTHTPTHAHTPWGLWSWMWDRHPEWQSR